MTRKLIYAANWKMYRTFEQTAAFIRQHQAALSALGSNGTIILCPSATAIYTVAQQLANSTVKLGGQQCAAHAPGAYTGQIAAADLAAARASYCLVGHSESRAELNLTNATVAKQATQALAAGLTPIVCIGESGQEEQDGLTEERLAAQLVPVLSACKNQPLIIAYEPLWAIGSGKTPTPATVSAIFDFLSAQIAQAGNTASLLYGGSVTGANAADFKQIALLDGFLVGRASLDFQEFKKIVDCW